MSPPLGARRRVPGAARHGFLAAPVSPCAGSPPIPAMAWLGAYTQEMADWSSVSPTEDRPQARHPVTAGRPIRVAQGLRQARPGRRAVAHGPLKRGPAATALTIVRVRHWVLVMGEAKGPCAVRALGPNTRFQPVRGTRGDLDHALTCLPTAPTLVRRPPTSIQGLPHAGATD